MTDTAPFFVAAPQALARLELWAEPAGASARFAAAFGADLPLLGQATTVGALRVIGCEARAWMVRGPLGEVKDLTRRLAAVAADDGAATDISGGLARIPLTGCDWRILLTHGGVFDAENPTFAPGCVAGTVIEHMAVRLDVVTADQVDVYVAASYAQDLLGFWTQAARGLDVR